MDRASAIFGVWVAPGALETIQKRGGRSPPPFARVSGAPGAAQTPKMTDFQYLANSTFFNQATVQPRNSSLPSVIPFGLVWVSTGGDKAI